MTGLLDPPGAGHKHGGGAVNPDGPRASDAPDPQNFINCMRDEFVQVRRLDGTLLGCMPAFGEGIDNVFTNTARTCAVMTGIIRGVIVPDDVDPSTIAGFIPRTGAKLAPPVRPDGTMEEVP